MEWTFYEVYLYTAGMSNVEIVMCVIKKDGKF